MKNVADQKKMVEAITPMDVDFAKWYTDVVIKADLVDYSSVRGCMIIPPLRLCPVGEHSEDFRRQVQGNGT